MNDDYKYIIADCLEILPTLQDNSFDLAFTDIFFNVGFNAHRSNRESVLYNDSMSEEEYYQFCTNVYSELTRISRGQIIFCGNTNIALWCRIAKPRDILIWYKPNGRSYTASAHLLRHEPILSYGEHRKLPVSVLTQTIKSVPRSEILNGIHPCPSSLELYHYILSKLKPSSVIDPFLGSGTTLAACMMLGIPCLGIEKNPAYEPDILKRIEQGKQSTLLHLME